MAQSIQADVSPKSRHSTNGQPGSHRSTLPASLCSEGIRLLRRSASVCPLFAAITAPLAALIDIPTLSQHWFTLNNVPQKNPLGGTIISAIALALSVMANVLLLMRFAMTKQWLPYGVKLSGLCWLIKFVATFVSLFFYSAPARHGRGYAYAEGVWCAVLSLALSGVIVICLTFHYIFAFGHSGFDKEDLRLEGRKFQLATTWFIVVLGLMALAYCRLEHWSYLDAIYFSLQTGLTIGYGDMPPKTAAGKGLVFPFAILLIAQLANGVSIIIHFIQRRQREERDRWRKKYSEAMHREALKRKPYATLIEEMDLIDQINLRQETAVQFYDLTWSGLALVAFWLIGACMFHYIEDWGYGDAIYAVIVLSLSIGYGDFAPHTPAGRVVYVVYALIGVPIVTSFAVQTVTGLFYTWSEHRYGRTLVKIERESNPEVFEPHSYFILKHHKDWNATQEQYLQEKPNEYRTRLVPADSGNGTDNLPSPRALLETASAENPAARVGAHDPLIDPLDPGESPSPKEVFRSVPPTPGLNSSTADAMHIDLVKELIDRMLRLEAQGRQLLIDSMDRNIARTLLLADRNLQIRDMLHMEDESLVFEDGDPRADSQLSATELATRRQAENEQYRELMRQQKDQVQHVRTHLLDSEDNDLLSDGWDLMLKRLLRYRSTFAELLVLSSTVLRLEGSDLNRFERWHVAETKLVHRSTTTDLTGLPRTEKVHYKLRDWTERRRSHVSKLRERRFASLGRDSELGTIPERASRSIDMTALPPHLQRRVSGMDGVSLTQSPRRTSSGIPESPLALLKTSTISPRGSISGGSTLGHRRSDSREPNLLRAATENSLRLSQSVEANRDLHNGSKEALPSPITSKGTFSKTLRRIWSSIRPHSASHFARTNVDRGAAPRSTSTPTSSIVWNSNSPAINPPSPTVGGPASIPHFGPKLKHIPGLHVPEARERRPGEGPTVSFHNDVPTTSESASELPPPKPAFKRTLRLDSTEIHQLQSGSSWREADSRREIDQMLSFV